MLCLYQWPLKLDTLVIQSYHSTPSTPAPISLLAIRKCPGWGNGRCRGWVIWFSMSAGISSPSQSIAVVWIPSPSSMQWTGGLAGSIVKGQQQDVPYSNELIQLFCHCHANKIPIQYLTRYNMPNFDSTTFLLHFHHKNKS